jgi:hypothetical protein
VSSILDFFKQRLENWVSFGNQAFARVRVSRHLAYCSKAAVAIIIIVIIIVTFLQGICSYILETNHISKEIYCDTVILFF